MLRGADGVGIARGSFGPRVRLPHQAALEMRELEHVLGVAGAVDLAALRIVGDESVSLGTAVIPIDRPREEQRPVAAEMDVGLLSGKQQELGVGLHAAGAEEGDEFWTAKVAGAVGVA